MPILPAAWNPPYHAVAVTAAQYATAADRVSRFASLNTDIITEAGPYYGKKYLSPGASFTIYFYPAEVGMLVMCGEDPSLYTNRADYRAMFEWVLSKQIRNGSTTYTRAVSGGTGTYTLGAYPERIPKSGTVNLSNPGSDQCMIAWGDRTCIGSQILTTIALCEYGKLAGYDAEWVTWWASYRQQIVDGIEMVPYDTTAHLVKQWDAPYYGIAFNSLDGLLITGHQIATSSWYYVACMRMAECCYRAGENQEAVDLYYNRAQEVKTAIQGKFRAASPTFDGVHLNWDRYQPQTMTNGALEGFTWNSGAGKIHVVEDPTDAANQLLKIEDDSGSACIGMARTFTRAQFRRPWQRARTAFVASQTNVAMWLWDLLDHNGVRILGLGLGADGNIKATSDGTTWVDLPTPMTYSTGTKTPVGLRFDWAGQQTEVWIGGASKGSVAMGGAAVDLSAISYRGGAADSDMGSVLHDDWTTYDMPGEGTDTGAMGYLPWATGADGNTISVEGTAFAAWAGILTSEQTLQAGRLMSLYYDKPDYSGVGEGDVFLRVPGLRMIKRNPGPWSEDYIPDIKVWPVSYYPGVYGVYVWGGYHYSYSHWPIWLMAQHSKARAQEAAGTLLDDIGLDIHAPYESAQNGVPNGTNYLQAAVSFLGMVKIESFGIGINTFKGPSGILYPLRMKGD